MKNRAVRAVRAVFTLSVVLVALSGVLLSGCKPSAAKLAAREAALNQEIETVFTKIQELLTANQAAEALALADKGLANPKYASQKTRFFGQKIDLLIAQGQEGSARAQILQAWKTDAALGRSVFGKIYGHYQQRNNQADIRAWCADLLSLKTVLPADLRSQVLSWQLSAALAMADEKGSLAAVRDVVSGLAPDAASPMLHNALGGLIEAGQHTFVKTLVRQLDGHRQAFPVLDNLVVSLSLRCVLAAKEWNNVTLAFQACVAQLPDDPLLKLSRTTFSTLQKNGQSALAETSARQLITDAITKTNSVNFASRVWVESGVATNKKRLAERLDELLAAQVSPVQVGNLFDRYFYDMVNDLDMIRSLCALGERILAVCSDPNTVNNVKVKVLDGAFITENYDLAVAMLEKGIPGKDKAWHDMSLPKVKAHRAMAQKKPREAVAYFRDFMNAWLTSDQKEEFDPTSGIAYSREWILGRNAHRIAGILDTIPDKAEADKARAEAKEYFRVALKKAENDAEAIKLLKEETKDMGL